MYKIILQFFFPRLQNPYNPSTKILICITYYYVGYTEQFSKSNNIFEDRLHIIQFKLQLNAFSSYHF